MDEDKTRREKTKGQELRIHLVSNAEQTVSGLLHSHSFDYDSHDFDWHYRPTKPASDELWCSLTAWEWVREPECHTIKPIVWEFIFSRVKRASKQHCRLENDTYAPSRRSANTSVTHSSNRVHKMIFLWSNFISTRSLSPLAPILPNQTLFQCLPWQLSKSHLQPGSSCDSEMLSYPENYRQQMF